MGRGKIKRSKKIKTSVVLIIVGGVLTIYCNRGYLKAKASVSWPSTKGEIISSELKRSKIREGKARSSRPDFYVFKARYQYEIGGEVYESQRVSFLSEYIRRPKRADIERIYASGRTVDVFYNPDAPGESTLITGVNKYNRSPHHFFCISVLIIGMFGIVVFGLNYLRKGND